MKRLSLIVVTLILSALSMMAADITPITNAFKSGNAASLNAWMDKEVDIALLETTRKCNANCAVSLLNTFFKSNKPAGFKVVHHADKPKSGFIVGKLPTISSEYRVNITYRAEGNKAIIQSIRIE